MFYVAFIKHLNLCICLSAHLPLLARLKYSKRLQEIGQEVDTTLMSDVEKVIRRGRITVIEYLFMEGIVTSLSNPGGAKGVLDDALASMGVAEFVQDDINGVIWSFTSTVLQGNKLV